MRYLIVDGHSVIFAWPDLRKLHARRTESARNELVKILTDYQDASGVRVVAVFDGQGGKANETSEPGGIQIFYSAAGQTADAIVERLVATYAQKHEITVATSDFMEQQVQPPLSARWSSPRKACASGWTNAQRDLARRIKQHRRK